MKIIVQIFALVSISALPVLAQTPSAINTSIPGVIEPLELRGEPQALAEPSELEERLLDVYPKSNDPKDLKNAKEKIDVMIQQSPDSLETLSVGLTLSCEIKSKDTTITTADIDDIIRLQKSAGNKDKTLFVQSESQLLTLKAKVDYDSSNHEKAVEDLYRAISVDIHDADNLLNSGGVGPETKSEPCAWYKPDLDQLIKERPTDYRVYLFRGLYYLVFARFGKPNQYMQQPIDDFERAAALNPKSPLPPYFLGKLYMSSLGVLFGTAPDASEKRTKAIAAYGRALQIDSHFTPGYAERAELYSETKRYQEAIKDYDKVIEADSKDSGAYNDRGLAKVALNNFYGAISDFDSALENKDKLDSKMTYENRGDAYVKVKNYDDAIQDYTQTIKSYLADEIFLMNIAQVKKIYPEYKDVPDDTLCGKLHEMFFRNMNYEDFKKQLVDTSRADFDTFLIPELFVKRGDTYVKAGDFRRGIIDHQRAANGYAYGRKTLDRWILLSKGPASDIYVDSQTAEFGDANLVKFWVKLTDTGSTAKGTYTVQQYAVECRLKSIDQLSFLKYNLNGTATNSGSGESGWQSIVPDTLGEQLYSGMCH